MSDPKKLIDKILSDAEMIAKIEISSAKDKANDIIQKAKLRAEDIAKKAKLEALEEAKEQTRRFKSVCDLAHKKNVLAMKREVLDAAFAAVVDDIVRLDDEPYLALMTRLLMDCSPSGEGAVCVAKKDKARLNETFILRANQMLKEKIGKGEVALLKETCDKKGGFVFVRGGLEIDCSVEALVALMREKIETDAAERLFEEGA